MASRRKRKPKVLPKGAVAPGTVGHMSRDEYRNALAKLEMTQAAAAELLGVHLVTSQRWAAEGVEGLPAVMVRLLAWGVIDPADIEKAR